MKIDGGHFYEESLEITEDGSEGTHQVARRVPGATPPRARQTPPGCLVALLGAPSRLYDPPGVKTLDIEEFWSFAAANLQRRKSHLWRADSAGEITSRKGRSPSSSSS